MDKDAAISIANEINKMSTADEVKRYLNSIGAYFTSDMAVILRSIVTQQPSLLTIVGDRLLDCAANTEEFYKLVLDVYQNTSNERHIDLIIQFCTKDSEMATWLVKNLKNMGSDAPRSLVQFIEWWAWNENPITTISVLPPTLYRVYRDKTKIVDLLRTTNYRDKKQAVLICSILDQLLRYNRTYNDFSHTFLENAKSLLLDISKQHTTNVKIRTDLQDPVVPMLILINQIFNTRSIDLEAAKKNLEAFPHLKCMMKNFDSMARTSSHPLIVWLSEIDMSDQTFVKKQVTDGTSPYAKVRHIEASLSLFPDSQPGLHGLQHDLLEPEKFFSARTELTVAARLAKKHCIKLRPPVKVDKPKGIKLDLEATIDGSKVLFEVSRKHFLKLEYESPASVEKHLILDKVCRKICCQIKHARHRALPVVLVIDVTRLHISDHDIKKLFYGDTPAEFHDPCHTSLSDLKKEENSIYSKTLDARVVSAIMTVNLDHYTADMPMKFDGDLFPAPHPFISLKDKTADSIRKAVFHTGA